MRRRLIVIACLVAVLLVAAAMVYKRWRSFDRSSHRTTFDSNPGNFSVPPFPTKEPESYQATRVITFTEAVSEQIDVAAPQRTTRVMLARLGEHRREEYEAGPIGTIVYLENAAGRFVLVPQARLYADANEAGNEGALGIVRTETETVSPDQLLNSPRPFIQYQKLEAEVIEGRITTKYRVTGNSAGNNENFIWVDEQLGMPVASRYTTINANRSTRVSIDLRDIRTEVDASMFVLPAAYRKVAASQILDLIRARKADSAVPNQRK